MIQIEALKLALEALKWSKPHEDAFFSHRKAITAIEEALEQPTSGDYVQPDLSVLKHSDNCRYWDDGEFCTCGALEYHEMQYWKAKALAQPAQQEPTGMLHIDRLDKWLDASLKERKAQRTWVGLTDKDWNRSKHNYDFQKGVDWAEPILKQKNGYAEEKNNDNN